MGFEILCMRLGSSAELAESFAARNSKALSTFAVGFAYQTVHTVTVFGVCPEAVGAQIMH